MQQGIGMTSLRTRERMVARLRELGVRNPSVLEVMRDTPRHLFLDEALSQRAYEDTALPIGYSQTLSQPYIVARMTELLLADGPIDDVLEIGTGSGYQTAVLAQLVGRVYTTERIGPLQTLARERLRSLRLGNVRYSHSDGSMGWDTHAPYSGILCTAAPEDIPAALTSQLAIGGRLVIPVGRDIQDLQVARRTGSGIEVESKDKVRFVPLLSGVQS